MRVLFLTHYYAPETGAAQTRLSRLARGLARAGVEVTVHTAPPHYPEGQILRPYRNVPLMRESWDGVEVIRTMVYPHANRGFTGRLANHLSLAASALTAAPFTGAADVIVAETPPLFTAAAAVPYARLKRAPLVVNVADRWPAMAVGLGMLRNRRLIAAAERLERACYSAAAAIAVHATPIAAALEHVPGAQGKVTAIPPAVDDDAFAPSPLPVAQLPLRVLYAGTVGLAQGLETLVDAAVLAGPEVLQVMIAGSGAELPGLQTRIRDGDAGNVELLGSVPAERVPGLYAQAHASAVLLRDNESLLEALPTKVLEAMASARAVVVAARGEAARFVTENGAGIAVAPDDPAALARALERLAGDRGALARYGSQGRERVEAEYSAERQVERWRDLLAEVAASSRSSSVRAPASRRLSG